MFKRTISLILMVMLITTPILGIRANTTDGWALNWTFGVGAVADQSATGAHTLLVGGMDGGGLRRDMNHPDTFTLEAEIWIDKIDGVFRLPEIKGLTQDGNQQTIVQVTLRDGHLSVSHASGDRNTFTTVPIEMGQSRITVEMNPKDGSFSVWLNGDSVVSGKKFIDSADVKIVTTVAYCATSRAGVIRVMGLDYYDGRAKNVKYSAEISVDDLILDENFDGAAIGMTADPIMKKVAIKDDEDDLSMMIPAGVANKYLSKSLGNYQGMLTVEADILVNDETVQIKIPDILIDGTGQGVLVSVIKSAVSVPYFKDGANPRASKEIALGEWFRITVQADSETDRFSVWVDGQEVIKDVPFYNDNKADALSVVRFNAVNADNPEYYVDNVRIYKGAARFGDGSDVQDTALPSATDLLSRSVMMKRGSNVAYMTNYRKEMSVTPFVEGGNDYFPLKQLAQGFNMDYVYDQTINAVVLSYHGNEIQAVVGENGFSKNGENMAISKPLLLKDDVVYATPQVAADILSTEMFFGDGILVLSLKGWEYDAQQFVDQFKQLFEEQLLPSVDIYVSPDGAASNDGLSIEKPLPSIGEAQKLARKFASGGEVGNIYVNIRSGTYYLDGAFRLTNADSRSGNYRTVYRRYQADSQMPLIDGGTRITNWKPYKNGIYVADIPEGKKIDTMYEDGARVTSARHPNTDYSRMVATPEITKSTFMFKDGDIPRVSNPLELSVFCWPGGPSGHINWSTTRLAVKSLDYSTRTVTLGGTAAYELGTGSRYFVYNSLDLLDAPGEFYTDTVNKRIYYMPIGNIDTAVIVAPAPFDMISASGTDVMPISNISFEGLEIRGTDFNKSNFMFTNVSNIEITGCKVYGSGHNGIYIKGASKNCVIENNEIYNTGFYGVFVEGSKNITTDRSCYGHNVSNNYIHDVGQMNGNAVGVRFAHSQYSMGRYNKVEKSPRNGLHILGAPDQNIAGKEFEGITVTEELAPSFKPAIYNSFEYNQVSNVVQDSQDTNAIGAWGMGEGNSIRKNLIHDSALRPITENIQHSFWFPIYFDEHSDYSYVSGNIVYDNQLTPGGLMRSEFMNNASWGNTVYNNIFADKTNSAGAITVNNMDGGLRRSKDFSARQNIYAYFPDYLYVISGLAEGFTVKYSDFNLLNSRSDKYLMTAAPVTTLEEWRAFEDGKFENNSIVSEAGFIDEQGKDFRLRYDSAAYMTGFQDINQSDMGLARDFIFADHKDTIDKLFVFRQGEHTKRGWASLEAGEKIQLDFDVRTKNGYLAYNDSLKVEYHSTDTQIASVSDTGQVTVNGNGRCEIDVTVSRDGKSVSKSFEVVSGDKGYTQLSILGISGPLEIGDKAELKVAGVTAFGRKTLLDNFTLATDNPIVEIDGKTLTIVGQGHAKITATTEDGTQGDVDVVGIAAKFARLDVDIDKQEYAVGDEIKITPTIYDSKGNQMDPETAQYQYEGDIGGVIIIEDGKIMAAKTGMGSVNIIATHQDGNVITNSARVAVLPENLSKPQGLELYNFSRDGGERTAGYAYEDSGKATIVTSGHDVWSNQDAFSALLAPISLVGNGKQSVSCAVESLTTPIAYGAGGNTAIHAAAGVTFRESLDADSAHVFLRYRLNGDIIMTYRTKKQGSTEYLRSSKTPQKPVELRLEHEGNTFSGYYKSTDGEWTLLGQVDIQMNDNIYAGVGLQSGVEGDFNDAVYSNIKIEKN